LSLLAAAHLAKETSASFSVGLYRDFARQGRITFRIVPALHPSDYVSKPDGVLSHDQAE
jgi:hypothetical protein